MRQLITTLIATLFATVVAASEMRVVNSPGDGFLNLRTGPGSGFAIVLPMTHGSTVEVLETKGGWRRVQHQESGAAGWAFGKYLAPFEGGVPTKFVHSPGDGFLNLRTGPGSGFAIVRRMYNGDAVEIIERKGSWVRVYHQSGAEGWCSEKFLRN
ncbi:MAG: SH3 domain-containing protein [Paracoccaceae bacterium]